MFNKLSIIIALSLLSVANSHATSGRHILEDTQSSTSLSTGEGGGRGRNTIVSVSQVSESVNLTDNVDYVITDATPFTTAGSVNIKNTEHAVLIIKSIKPSKVISSWLKTHVFINGEQAINGNNCQVKMYASGAIIMPYAKDIKPLTVYSEQNFGGESCNDFGLENSDGYMNTLSDAKLNNKIRSFKLKRGYMVTFSTRKDGRGYSRCFIADKEDLEINTLPAILDKKISSYRVFVWQNAKKAGLASDTRKEANAAVNSSWCYTWGLGENMLPDFECVPNHIKEDWPTSRECGRVTYSCHMKTNNEPGNSADDTPQDVATVLANWENLMRTGMRLCSESSHDGSMGHLKAFIDSIDARGWRCDIIDLHCYWPTDKFNNLNWYSSYYGNGRPIWISEWVWGASWSNNGAFAVSNRDDFKGNWQNNYNGTKPILEVLNANSKVERYAFWNSEANCSKIYLDGQLSTLGEYYATMGDDLGYNPANEYIPKNPPMKAPTNLKASFDKATKKVTLQWHEVNGEYNQSMDIMVKTPGNVVFTKLQSVDLQEEESDYSITVDGIAGNVYKIRIYDLNKTALYTNEATAVNEKLEYGDDVSVVNGTDVKTMYLGGNMLINGDFELGAADWTNGKGETITAPYFQIVPEAGINNSAFLQCYGNGSSNADAAAIRKVIDIEENTSYYVGAAGCNNNPDKQQISVSTSNTAPGTLARVKFPKVTEWAKLATSFTTTTQKYLWITLFELGGKAQFDDFKVCKLFDTPEEALADALAWEKKRAEAFKAFNTKYNDLNEEIDGILASNATANEIESAIISALKTIKTRTADAAYEAIKSDAERAIPEGLEYVYNTTAIKDGDFGSTYSWTTKCGTYKNGDQRTATHDGKKCWNAWWSLSATGNEAQTMEVKQTVTYNSSDATTLLSHGLYALECKALTEHLCETDQHAYLTNNETNETLVSVNLPIGKLDLPCFKDKWTTLSTSYMYVNERGSITVGFTGSKKGAKDGLWMEYGKGSGKSDNREGWWSATDFRLRFIPVYQTATDASGWATICLPYSFIIPDGVKLYQFAGISKDGTKICLEEVTAPKAGYPYVFHSNTTATLSFYETGTAVSSAETNANGLRGNFAMSAANRYPLNSFVLQNGVWNKVTERFAQASFAAFIYKTTQLPVVDEWNGTTLPLSEAVETAIKSLPTPNAQHPAPTYDLSGRRVNDSQKGVVIKEGKKQTK